jgi:hypothetical protein
MRSWPEAAALKMLNGASRRSFKPSPLLSPTCNLSRDLSSSRCSRRGRAGEVPECCVPGPRRIHLISPGRSSTCRQSGKVVRWVAPHRAATGGKRPALRFAAPAPCGLRHYVTQRDAVGAGRMEPDADSQPSGKGRLGLRGTCTSGGSPPSGRTITRSRSPLSARLTWIAGVWIAGVWIAGAGSGADMLSRPSSRPWAPGDGPSGTSSTKATDSAATTAPAVSMRNREGRIGHSGFQNSR